MRLRRTILITCLLPLCAGAVHAQIQQAPPQQPPPCVQEFFKLREDAEKKAAAIKAAGERKAPPNETCSLFNTFVAAQTKMLKYANESGVWCGIPHEVADNLKKAIAQVSEIRTRVCRAAAAPTPPQGPSLSDVLSNPVPNSNNIKTGRGTYDTLTGNPLGK